MARLIGQKALDTTTAKSKAGGGDTKAKGGTSSKASKPVAPVKQQNAFSQSEQVKQPEPLKKVVLYKKVGDVYYFEFQSIKAIEHWTERKLKSLSADGEKEIGILREAVESNYNSSEFYYANSPEEVYNAQKFCAWNLVQKYRIKLRSELQKLLNIKQKNDVETKRLEYNDRELGAFSFDRAAMRLRTEYPPKSVRQLRIALHGSDGSKIVSDNKRSFAYFKNILKPKPTIRIFLEQSGYGDGVVYQGLAPYFLAEMLIQKGYKVEINGIRAIENDGVTVFTKTLLKKFNGELNANTILFASSDPRFIKWKMWNYTVCQLDDLNLTPGSWGIRSTYFSRYFIEKNLINPGEIPLLMQNADSEESMFSVIQEAYDLIMSQNNQR